MLMHVKTATTVARLTYTLLSSILALFAMFFGKRQSLSLHRV